MLKFYFTLLLWLTANLVCLANNTISVVQLNIWKNCNGIEGGIEAIADEIARLKPELVSLNEISTTDASPTHELLLNALAERGLTYYSGRMQESDILSIAPVSEIRRLYPDSPDVIGSVIGVDTEIHGVPLSVYSAHLDYLNDAYYNVRGIDGSTWKPCKLPETVEEILQRNDMSSRDEAIAKFIESAADDIARGRTVILCGDFNEPSHLDWTEATANLYDHNGFVVDWTCTRMLDQAGYADAYRTVWPDPVAYPGITFPASCESVDVKQLAWAPEADERDRIDYIFYNKSSGITPVSASLLGPDKSISHSQRVADNTSDPLITPLNVWPTDHRGVLVTLLLPSTSNPSSN